jgi:hypothetical protein
MISILYDENISSSHFEQEKEPKEEAGVFVSPSRFVSSQFKQSEVFEVAAEMKMQKFAANQSCENFFTLKCIKVENLKRESLALSSFH